ncbi:MAG: FAD-binding oxidoreductase [Acidimicrobiia bacterium]|nr:FAD-binding oxidoreductase [Acidimicrobiia bacterium]
MTGLRSTLGRMFGGSAAEVEGAPEADLVAAPTDADELARLLDFASEHGLTVLPWGAGTHQGFGGRVDPDIVVSTAGFGEIVDWQPEDLTAVVGAGVALGELDDRLTDRRQSAVLPETSRDATVGGVVAAGVSGWRRLRYGPTRDRMLEVTLVTGDGRIVRGGARVVKNVTGYDLPRLLTGSLGSLGVITSVCLKLWPLPERTVTVVVDDPVSAAATAFRPLAVLETRDRSSVHLAGTAAEVDAQSSALGGEVLEGSVWPDGPDGECVVRVRVPPADLPRFVERLSGPFVAAHGVGEIVAAVGPDEIAELRSDAEAAGGSVVVERAPEPVYDEIDPWGTAPATLPLQRRIKGAFDPVGVMVPGRLPGGL